MIDQRTAPYAALLLRITISGYFIAALYGKCSAQAELSDNEALIAHLELRTRSSNAN
ncbi:hypothetical protein [Bradyrhizobium sp. USDA 4451]